MYRLRLAAALCAVCWVASARVALAADEATLVRVFLKDGKSLVSYGEPALVNNRVVFSMPTTSTPNPPLQLVDVPLARVDWERTTRYATAARASHYLAFQASADYAALSSDIARTLSDVAATPDPAKRIAIVEKARAALADWPQQHYNFRATEVLQMLGMLDEAIADLRAATGARKFDLALTAFVDPPTISEPLLPAPTAQETIEQTLLASTMVDNPYDRTALLATVMASVDRGRAALPPEWATKTRLEAEMAMRAEQRVDASYRSLSTRLTSLATYRARMADIRGLERLLHSLPERDAELGAKRPDMIQMLAAAIEEKLDAARRLQLARDRWALRAADFQRYQLDVAVPLALFTRLTPVLEDIKALSGSTAVALRTLERGTADILKRLGVIAPPEELAAAHALIVSAVQLSANAGQMRRDAVMAGDMNRAWNASSAAAGALMLGDKARLDILAIVQRPQLNSPR
jgi:hypothetical protein